VARVGVDRVMLGQRLWDTWSSERSTHVRTAKPTKPQAADRVFELLAEAIAIDSEVEGIPASFRLKTARSTISR
jgi:hypothetical protein